MAKIFEDELMDLQADYVSLCMEAMEGIADEIFIYISIEADRRELYKTSEHDNGRKQSAL